MNRSEATRSLRVAMILDRWDPERGGAERAIRELVDRLAHRGDRITFLCLSGVDDPGASQPPRWELERLKIRTPWRFWREKRFGERASALAMSARFDVALGFRHVPLADLYVPHGGLHRAAMMNPLDAINSGWRRAWKRTLRHFSLKHRVFQRAEARLVQAGVPVVALSDMVAEDFRGLYPRAKIHKIFGGVDLDRFSKDSGADESREVRAPQYPVDLYPVDRDPLDLYPLDSARGARLRLLFLAHQPELKGLNVLMNAVAQSGDDVELMWLGRGRHRHYVGRAKALGMEDRFFVMGDVPHPERYYRWADALVHPTFYDPCSRVVLEALASGCPVITTRRNGASEIVNDDCGMVIDDPSPSSLSEAIEQLRSKLGPNHETETNARERMGRMAREVAKQASLDLHLDRLIALIDRVARVSAESRR